MFRSMALAVCWIGVGGVLAVLSAIQADAAERYVVIAVEPKSEMIQPGKVYAIDDTLIVPSGTIVTLLGEDGSVNSVSGPVDLVVTPDSTSLTKDTERIKNRNTISKIARLLTIEKKNVDKLGTSRGFGQGGSNNGSGEPWTVFISGANTGCVRRGDAKLGRLYFQNELRLMASDGNGGDPTRLIFEKGQKRIKLPDNLFGSSGVVYLEVTDRDERIQVHLLPENIGNSDPVSVIGWMIDQGCDDQALRFVFQLSSSRK